MLVCAATAHAQLGGDGSQRNAWTGTGLRAPLAAAFTLPLRPVSAPVVGGGKIVVPGADRVTAFDAATGTQTWSVPSAAPELATDGVRVFLAVPNGVAALDLASGKVAWTAIGSAATGPVVAGDRVLVGSGTDVVAYAASTGAVAWRAPVFMTGARPAVVGDRAYVVGGCRAQALSVSTGLPLWLGGACLSDTGLRTVVGGALVWGEGGAIYSAADGTRVAAGGGPGTAGAGVVFANPLPQPPATLVAADAASFAPRWMWTPAPAGVIAQRPVVVDGTVFTVVGTGTDAYVAGLDPGTGAERFAAYPPTAGAPTGPLVAGPDLLLVPVGGGVDVLRNAPADAVGVTATLPRNVVPAGTDTVVSGQVTPIGPRAVGLQADVFPFDGKYAAAGFAIASRQGFSFPTPVTRNTRFRIAADGVFYAPTEVYAQPVLKVNYKATKKALIVRATLRVAAARGLERAGKVAVYRLRSGSRKAVRLGRGSSGSNGVAHFVVRIPPTLKKKDSVLVCLRGASRQGFGPSNVLDRRCGNARITFPPNPSRLHVTRSLDGFVSEGARARLARFAPR